MLAAGTKEAGNFLIRQAEGKQRELHKWPFPEPDLRKRVGSSTLAKMSGPGAPLPASFTCSCCRRLLPSSRANSSEIGLVAKKEQSPNISMRVGWGRGHRCLRCFSLLFLVVSTGGSGKWTLCDNFMNEQASEPIFLNEYYRHEVICPKYYVDIHHLIDDTCQNMG